jgi:hypothetical protein
VEQAHNGGAVHTVGVTHIDVRDAHGTPGCPFPNNPADPLNPFNVICAQLGFTSTGAKGNTDESPSQVSPAKPRPSTPVSPPPSILPTPLPSPPRVPLPTPIPSPPLVSRAAAAGASLPSPSGPTVLDRVEGWALAAGEAVYGFFERFL